MDEVIFSNVTIAENERGCGLGREGYSARVFPDQRCLFNVEKFRRRDKPHETTDRFIQIVVILTVSKNDESVEET
jgi:hypothetical protein